MGDTNGCSSSYTCLSAAAEEKETSERKKEGRKEGGGKECLLTWLHIFSRCLPKNLTDVLTGKHCLTFCFTHSLTLSLFVFLLFLSQLDCSLNWNLLGKHAIHEVNNITYTHLSCDSQAAVVVHWMASPLGRFLLSCVCETILKHPTFQFLSQWSPNGVGLSFSR